MQQHFCSIEAETPGEGFYELTDEVMRFVQETECEDGLLTVFLKHTSASVLTMENADPTVLEDLRDAIDRLAPQSQAYKHSTEGPDDMPAHIKTALLPQSLSIPVRDGRLQLGTWQGIFLAEHRMNAHIRQVELHFMGE